MANAKQWRRSRALIAARLVGACALGVIAQIAVHMPQGYFGAADHVTRFGAAYALALTGLTALLLLAVRGRRRLSAWLAPAIPAVNIGLFLPALASDPLVAGLVVVFNAVLLAQQLFPARHLPLPVAPGQSAIESEVDARLERLWPALRNLGGASLALSVAVVGYRLSGHALAQGVCLVLAFSTLGVAFPLLRLLYREGRRSVLLIAAPVVASVIAAPWPWAMLSFLAVAQAVLLLVLVAQHQTTAEILRDFFDHPSRLIVVSFGGAILVGTVLLTFPVASAGPEAISPLDALFTATSATCVTGLVVLDTPVDFSPFGQAVILGLIQVGGLGIMTLSTFATVMLGGSLGLRGEQALGEMLDLQTAPSAYRLTRFIVLSTLAVEAVGAVGLAGCFAAAGAPVGDAIWRGVFHSVSAFCNAGFALQSDSIVMFREAPLPLLLHAALIVLGGLGFVVLAGVWTRFGTRVASRLGERVGRRVGWRTGRPVRRSRSTPLSVQARTVLVASGVLLVAGTVLFAACEWRRSLAGLSVGDRLVNALFQSVTLRTAGFNSVDFGGLGAATVLFMMLFMFIGASPGSTGGGIKTTTAVVLLAAIRSTTRRGESTTLSRREVPRDIVYRSLAIVVISVAVVVMGLFLLLLFEDQPFLDLLFEAVSAFGTVGLSLGATPALGPAGKLTIIAVMFIGRIGPLTLALLLGTGAERRVRFRYPETRLMVG